MAATFALRVLPLCLCLALGACALAPPHRGPAAASGRDSAFGGPSDGDAEPGSVTGENSASQALLVRSRAEQAAGQYEQAEASVERALRIAPNDAALWLALGEVKLAAGDTEQAGLMARKALTLAGRDEGLRAKAEHLIASARR
ncbi:MAG TPA: tetratricopeptide repeat protein [Gammaproteobacteria bacterium]|nr:tetratricopeptide repeat protein [Gammaproteobacteria bacterium]